jgi:hypothetical protein
MKKTISILLALFIIFAAANTFAATKKAPAKAAKPIQGKVVSLNEVVTGSFTAWKKADAEAAANQGTPFVLMVGEGAKAKIYFVYNEDGSFASKKLAKYSFNKKIGVVGKTKTVNGLQIIIAETIEAME